MTPSEPGPEDPARPTTWQEALDRLEAHAEHAERVIRGLDADAVEPWAPPTDLGPIPEDFIPRARLLLQRQHRLMAAIPSVLADNRQQQRIADRVSGATVVPAAPVYFDVTA